MNFNNFLGLGEVADHIRRLLMDTPGTRFWALILLPVLLVAIWRLPDILTAIS